MSFSDNLKDERLKFGLYAGFFGIISSLIIYLIDFKLNLEWYIGVINLIGTFSLVAFGTIKRRRQTGGYMSYGSAMVSCLNIYLVATIISLLFYNLLTGVIDPDLQEIMKKGTLEKMEKTFTSFNMPQDQIDQAMADIEAQDYSPSILNFFKQLLSALAMGLVFSLIMAIFLRKEKPIFE